MFVVWLLSNKLLLHINYLSWYQGSPDCQFHHNLLSSSEKVSWFMMAGEPGPGPSRLHHENEDWEPWGNILIVRELVKNTSFLLAKLLIHTIRKPWVTSCIRVPVQCAVMRRRSRRGPIYLFLLDNVMQAGLVREGGREEREVSKTGYLLTVYCWSCSSLMATLKLLPGTTRSK